MPNFANKDMCTGCTACASVCPKQCIKMKRDENGFVFPEISEQSSCVECGLCEQICPIVTKTSCYKILPDAYAAFSKEESLRMDSSSGGIFSEIAKSVIGRSGVVYGAAYNKNFEVHHCCVDSVEGVSKLRGAKYSESYLGNTFSEILQRLKQEQLVLFVGTPCQVAGLKSFVKKDFDNLICIDFVCHGVPSPMAWKEYIKFRVSRDSNGKMPININLRSKDTGWSRYQYSNLFQYENGNRYSCISSQSLFMKLFVGDYISRPSCGNCSFKGYHRVSDITLGDFWGIWDIAPELDDNKGTSVILIQSQKGKYLWNEIKENTVFKEVSVEQASRKNQSMLMSSKAKENRERVLNTIREGKIETCAELFIMKETFIITRLRNKIGKLNHAISQGKKCEEVIEHEEKCR